MEETSSINGTRIRQGRGEPNASLYHDSRWFVSVAVLENDVRLTNVID